MARLRNATSLSPGQDLLNTRGSLSPAAAARPRGRPRAQPQARISPSPSPSSDKENRSRLHSNMNSGPKSTGPLTDAMERAPKRRRTEAIPLSEQGRPQSAQQVESEQDGDEEAEEEGEDEDEEEEGGEDENDDDTRYYDPEQSMAERQQLRRSMRDLNAEAVNMRAELIKANDDGLKNLIARSNELYEGVKQTSDATVDSRFLVTAGDITLRKAQAVVIGENAQSVDLDEFVGKCITFMRQFDPAAAQAPRRAATQRASGGRRSVQARDEDEDEDDPDNGLDWARLGRLACFPHNSRPPVPGFLLGPLSVQKRARRAVQRRANQQQQRNNAQETRPDELEASDLSKNESSDLTRMCQKIHRQMRKSISTGEKAIERAERERGRLDDDEVMRLAERHGMDDAGGLSMFKFALNPHSFGQSVENLFYLSFLIRDGWVGVTQDGRGLPSISNAKNDDDDDDDDGGNGNGSVGGKQQQLPESERAKRDRGKQRHQAVLSLDFETWQGLCEELGIDEPMVPHRTVEEGGAGTQVGRTGWY